MVGLSPLPVKDEESSSRGCEPAKVYMKVKWGDRREIILLSHSRCSKINACCLSCDRDVINADITTSDDDSDFDRASRS